MRPLELIPLFASAKSLVGIGPRIYLMKSVTTGKAGGEVIGETDEISTQIGGGLPFGVEFKLGPGALTMSF